MVKKYFNKSGGVSFSKPMIQPYGLAYVPR